MLENFDLSPHPSGHPTCFIATLKNGEKRFVKFPRTDNEIAGAEEIYAELLGEKILSLLGIPDLGSTIEKVNLRTAIVQRYHEKNWTNVVAENLEIVNFGEWPLLLAAETWMRQSDRSPGKHEHVGLSVFEGIGRKYRAIPLDLGHAFIGHPSGYQGLDEDFTPAWVNSLFWSDQSFKEEALDEAIHKIESLVVVEATVDIVKEMLGISSWSQSAQSHLWAHADQIAHFLLVRRNKLPTILREWWIAKNSGINAINNPVNTMILP